MRDLSHRIRYLRVHGNEPTAAEVLTAHMETSPGVAYIVENTTRNVEIEGAKLDPNRLFTREGAARNLKALNPDLPQDKLDAALDFLDRERPHLITALLPEPEAYILALHNNSEGYGVDDEVTMSDHISLADRAKPHEFCLCTNPVDFDALRKGPFNVVLQSATPPTEDGSLSRLAARMGIRYVNIEAGIGKAEKQKEMLRWITTKLDIL